MTAPDTIPLTWAVRVEDVPARGLAWRADATETECAQVAKALELLAVKRLTAAARIEAIAGGLYRMTGRLQANVVQACVITLEPVSATIDEPLAIEFRPADLVEDELATTPDFDDAFDVEPIAHGQLQTGRIAYELLSASLDPYPRAPGAALGDEPVTARPQGADPINPFAVLAKLRPKS